MDTNKSFQELKKYASKLTDRLSEQNLVVMGALAVSDSCERFNSYLLDHGVNPMEVYQEIGTGDVDLANLFGDIASTVVDLDSSGRWIENLNQYDDYDYGDNELGTPDSEKPKELSNKKNAGKIPGVQDGTGPFGKGKDKGKGFGPCEDKELEDPEIEKAKVEELKSLFTKKNAGKIPGVQDGTGPLGKGRDKGRKLGPCKDVDDKDKKVIEKKATYVNNPLRHILREAFRNNTHFNDTDRGIIMDAQTMEDVYNSLKKTSIWGNPNLSLQFMTDLYKYADREPFIDDEELIKIEEI